MERRIKKRNTPLKVVRIIPFLDFGGVEQRIKLTALALRSVSNLELVIVVLGHGGQLSAELERNGIKPLILDQKVKIPNFKLIRNLRSLLKDFSPDVVHCSGSEANFHGLIAAKWAGVPVKIGEEIGFPNHHLLWRPIFKMAYLCADRVIGISKAVVDKIVALGEVPPEKTCEVYNPVEIEKDSIPILPKRAHFTFITVCRLVPIKNLEGLLKAFSQLLADTGSDKVQLHIVGSGPEEETLGKLCETLQISGKVTFLGYQNNVTGYLRQADAFVLPSFSEGFSISLVEAMLCELPCIVTKVGGPSEIVQEGKTGFLIDPSEIALLALAMENVYQMSEKERLLMGSEARKEAIKRFSVDRYIEELLKIYRIGS